MEAHQISEPIAGTAAGVAGWKIIGGLPFAVRAGTFIPTRSNPKAPPPERTAMQAAESASTMAAKAAPPVAVAGAQAIGIK